MRGTTGPTVGTGEQTQLRETSGSKAHLAPFYLADPRPPADTEARPAVPVAEPGLAHRRSHTPAIIGTAAVVVLAVVIAVVIATRGTAPAAGPSPTTTAQTRPSLVQEDLPPAPVNVVGKKSGDNIGFSWTNPKPLEGDSYQWRRTDQDQSATASWAASATTSATVVGAARACIEVMTIRANSALSDPATSCFPKS